MTVWFHLPTIFDRRFLLRFVATISLSVALITTLFLAIPTRAEANINRTLNFQGRLLSASGTVVPDGHYNIQFKIYQDGTGTAGGNPDGTLKWTETYLNNGGSSGVFVRNGLMSVNLGSQTPFGNNVDWNQDTLWLSINIAGSATDCTSFGTTPCVADGEMLPMKRLTASPYAMNAGAVNGKTADNFIQLAQGVQTDASNNTSSIFINKTGTGNLLQLQSSGKDVYTITNTGNIELSSGATRSLSVGSAATDVNGSDLVVLAGWGGSGTTTTGGTLYLQGGATTSTNGDGGNVSITGGAGTGTGKAGSVFVGTYDTDTIQIGSAWTASGSQTINIGNNSGDGTTNILVGSSGATGNGTTTVQSKDSVVIKTEDTTRATFTDTNTVYFGNGVSASNPDNFTIQGTNSTTNYVNGGSLTIQGGDATIGDAKGGDVILRGGDASGNGTDGLVVLTTPAFSTVTNDANCYTGGAVVAASCWISAASLNSSSAVIVGFSGSNQTAYLPDPGNTTAGRILYVMAANDSESFTLSANADTTRTVLQPKTTATMMWNGTAWTIAGTASPTALSDLYNTDSGSTNIQIGDINDSTTTLLTLDRAATAPDITDEALLGSMYYDTTLGILQCYEATGWGSCSTTPDTFVTLSPEYANAVINGSGTGEITTDICSDALNINDGSALQPTVCGTNETYNFYHWTTSAGTEQTKSIYVTYQLPSSFKQFVGGSTALSGRTDHANATASYEIYRNSDAGLVACGSAVQVSTGVQTSWQTGTATSTADPANCSFGAGDSIVFKINLAATSGANAYVSNLNFAFSNN